VRARGAGREKVYNRYQCDVKLWNTHIKNVDCILLTAAGKPGKVLKDELRLTRVVNED
jgi:hypothetical protein